MQKLTVASILVLVVVGTISSALVVGQALVRPAQSMTAPQGQVAQQPSTQHLQTSLSPPLSSQNGTSSSLLTNGPQPGQTHGDDDGSDGSDD